MCQTGNHLLPFSALNQSLINNLALTVVNSNIRVTAVILSYMIFPLRISGIFPVDQICRIFKQVTLGKIIFLRQIFYLNTRPDFDSIR